MHDFLQPYLSDVVNALVGLAVASIIALVARFRVSLVSYITTHTNASQRSILHVVSSEAVAYAATVFKEQNGDQKLESALTYVNTRLKPLGISFSVEELRGAVEKAYSDYQAKAQTSSNVTNSVQVKDPFSADQVAQTST